MEKKDITKEMLSEKGMLDISKYVKQDKAFYRTNEWLSESNKYKEVHPFCEVCLKDKIEKPSEIVHHITPISQGGDPYDENNLLAICKKCHREIHPGIGIRIDSNSINSLLVRKLMQKETTPEDEWWGSGKYDLYNNKQGEIRDIIDKAKALEKNEMAKSIELYFSACKLIDDWEKIMTDDPLLEKAYCQNFGVSSFRAVPYPINRLSLLLEKSKRYADCIQSIHDYQEKDDKRGLLTADLEAIQKRKIRVVKKLKMS